MNNLRHPGSDVPHLTGVRAVAAALVLLLHLDQVNGRHMDGFFPPIAQGYLGVDVFFILSGMIISHVYANSPAVSTLSGYATFIWYRFARLYPIHLLTLVALFGMVAAKGLLNTNFWTLETLPFHLLMLHAWQAEVSWNVPAWSISAEWAAYVLFPAFAFFILRDGKSLLGLAVVVTLFAWFHFETSDVGLARSFFGIPAASRVLAEFALGVIIYRAIKHREPAIAFDFIAVAAFLGALFAHETHSTVQVLLLGIFLGSAALSAGVLRTFLASRLVVFLGKISYAVYMIHFPIIKLIQNFNQYFGLESPAAPIGVLLVVIWATVIVLLAALVYRYFEIPTQRWLRRLLRERTRTE